MKNEASVIKLSLYLVKSRFTMGSRVDKSNLIVAFIGLSILLSILGGLTSFFAVLMRSNDLEFNKDDVFFFLLTLILSVFAVMIFGALTGMSNPFISSIEDTYLLKRLPIDQQILFSSSIIIKVIQITFFLFFFVIFLILPPMIILTIPIWRIIFIFMALFSGFYMALIVSIIVFFAFSNLRKKYQWINMLKNPGAPLLAIPYFGTPVLMFVISDSYGNSALMQFFSSNYLPIANSITAVTGFMLRSSIPTASWMSLLISLIQLSILTIFALKFSKQYSLVDDIESLLPVLVKQQLEQESMRVRFNLFKSNTAQPVQTIVGIEGRNVFKSVNNVFLLIKIYLLALFRIKHSRRTLIILIITTLVYIILRLTLILSVDQLLLIKTILVLAISNIPNLIYMVDKNDPILFPIDPKYLFTSKSLLIFTTSFIFSVPFFLEPTFNSQLGLLILLIFSIMGGAVAQTGFKHSKFNLVIFLPLISIFIFFS